MKINENSALNTSKLQSGQVYETSKSGGSSSVPAGRAADTDDNIDLGSQASLLSQTQAAGASELSANVQRLQALVQSGQYQVDTAALSHSIVNATINGY
jgi:anti-sigma28 factor (negative regulator of flagellin synthesis)